MTELPHLLVIHGNMAPLGGAERDLLVALPAHLRRWSVSLATLNAPKLVHDRCRDLGVDLVTPESPWDQPVGGLDEVTAAAGRSARRAWRSLRTSAMGTTLDVAIERADAALIVIGPGTLEILEHLPLDLPLHAFLVEMHRGVHDDVLHRRFDGTPKRPMWFTKIALSYLRRWDRSWHRRLWNRPMTAISSNTPTSIRRLAFLPTDGLCWSTGSPANMGHEMHHIAHLALACYGMPSILANGRRLRPMRSGWLGTSSSNAPRVRIC